MALLRRRIELDFILGNGNFGEQGEESVKVDDSGNTATLAGLRVSAHVKQVGGSTLGDMQLQVYGLPPALLNRLSDVAQYAMFLRRNRVILSAGDDERGVAVVFEGTITQSWADLSSQPDSVLHIMAMAGAYYLAKPATPSSFRGTADAAVIIDGLAHQMGYTLENNGVSVKLATPYYDGTIVDQIRACAADANVDAIIIDADRKVVLLPKGGTRGGLVPLISPATGMVGYPVHDSTGVIVTTVFNRDVIIRGKVKVESSLPNAVGTWLVVAVTHDLESEMPGGGQWYTKFQATTLDNPHAQPTLQ